MVRDINMKKELKYVLVLTMIFLGSFSLSAYASNIITVDEMMFDELLKQAKEHDENSVLYKHHIRYIEEQTAPYADNAKDRSDPPAEGKGKIRRNKIYRFINGPHQTSPRGGLGFSPSGESEGGYN